MISYKNITKKRKKFGLSQEELAKRLGISRPTLLKIEKGERKLTAEEKKNIEQIFALVSDFDTSKECGNVRVSIPQEKLEKFEQVLLYVLEKVGAKPNVGMTVLYKLLYFIDFDYYEKYEEQLMGLRYFKNTHGPAPRDFKKVIGRMKKRGDLEEVHSTFFSHEQTKYLPRKESDLSVLSGRELEMIDSVLDRYSDKTAKQLSDLSHEDMPWKATKGNGDIDYELVFYRPDKLSVREYDEV